MKIISKVENVWKGMGSHTKYGKGRGFGVAKRESYIPVRETLVEETLA